MVKPEIIELINDYLKILTDEGILLEKVYLFGSYAKGNYDKDSDIDLLLVSPLFDEERKKYLHKIWLATKISDYKIEPIMVGMKKFSGEEFSPIVEIAKHEGIEITFKN